MSVCTIWCAHFFMLFSSFQQQKFNRIGLKWTGLKSNHGLLKSIVWLTLSILFVVIFRFMHAHMYVECNHNEIRFQKKIQSSIYSSLETVPPATFLCDYLQCTSFNFTRHESLLANWVVDLFVCLLVDSFAAFLYIYRMNQKKKLFSTVLISVDFQGFSQFNFHYLR